MPVSDPSVYNLHMRQETIDRLLALNQEFYQSFAAPFSETRGRIQPGVLQVIRDLPEDASILDVGCGNGTLASKLSELGHRGPYVGLDAIPELLMIARENCSHPNASFLERDIAKSNWVSCLPGPFDRIYAFSVVHHLPGQSLREQIFGTFHRLLHPEGRLIFSVWNFLASHRLRGRVLPWDRVDLDHEDLDPGDYLLDWRRGGLGLRYVHVFEPDELAEIANRTGFKIFETYHSDGEGGKLGYYQVWQRV
jgi:tRNA (uracil-5-)-methyltransferase TRM9